MPYLKCFKHVKYWHCFARPCYHEGVEWWTYEKVSRTVLVSNRAAINNQNISTFTAIKLNIVEWTLHIIYSYIYLKANTELKHSLKCSFHPAWVVITNLISYEICTNSNKRRYCDWILFNFIWNSNSHITLTLIFVFFLFSLTCENIQPIFIILSVRQNVAQPWSHCNNPDTPTPWHCVRFYYCLNPAEISLGI